MKFIYIILTLLLACGNMLSANNNSSSTCSENHENVAPLHFNRSTIDTIPARKNESNSRMMMMPGPKVEINGMLQITDLPLGTGTELLADANGNLVKKDISIMPPSEPTDSLTMEVTFTSMTPLIAGTYQIAAVDRNTNPGGGDIFSYVISKKKDVNTIPFLEMYFLQSDFVNVVLEIKFYKQGASTPYFSHKLKKIKSIPSYGEGFDSGSDDHLEVIYITADVFGMKDHVAPLEFAYNQFTGMTEAY